MAIDHAGRRRSRRIKARFSARSHSIRQPCASRPRPKRVPSTRYRIAGIAIERKRSEDRIPFPGQPGRTHRLPNRALLKDRLSQALLYAQRYDRWVTVVFVDLDNFKIVNDSLGHNAGDELLKTVAGDMVNSVRATDTVVRLGGDEFVVLLLDQPKERDVISQTVQKLRAALAEPVNVGGHELRVTGSIGIANYPNDGMDADELMANADAAMYRAKEIGRDNFQFYAPAFNTRAHEKFLLQEELRNAVVNSQFVLHYQPQVDLRTGRIFAVEALIRWKHPTWAWCHRSSSSRCRGDRPDRADRRLGAARSVSTEQGLAGFGPAAHRRFRERIGAAIQGKELDRARWSAR
jgi:diguanylate cyclase (GGDEF)-like protein